MNSVTLILAFVVLCYYGIVFRMEWLLRTQKEDNMESKSDSLNDLLLDIDEELQQSPLTDAFAREERKFDEKSNIPFTVIREEKKTSI